MTKKSLEEFSDAELRSELTRRAKAAAEQQIQIGKEHFDALETSAADLYGKLKGILNEASDEVREELTKHIKTLPDLTNITKGTSILKQQAKTPKVRRNWSEEQKKAIVKEYEGGASAAQLALKHSLSTSQIYSWYDKYKTKE